ncbi:hypothetical protein P8452_60830 [Trifolium repens]|nr:hypothetical protein P8452_60830 [Trifolium repens]
MKSSVPLSRHTYASIQRKHLKAKSEIVHKVCDIIKKQLAVPDDSNAIGECKFTNICEVSYLRGLWKEWIDEEPRA